MDMSPLAALIHECKELFLTVHGVQLTNGDIARRSGGRLTRQHVQQFATDDQHKMPAPEKIVGLALGLQVPHSVVLDRALQTYGYKEPGYAAPTTPAPAGAAPKKRILTHLDPSVAEADERDQTTLDELSDVQDILPGSPATRRRPR